MMIKKKRVSKKSKQSWRKHVNITDVEEFLEDQRLEERLGPPLETLSNDQLFKVDVEPTPERLSARERKRLKFQKTPKCFSILQPFTNVPDPIRKRNRVRSKEERKNELIKKKEADNAAKGILKHRQRQSLEDRKASEAKKNAEAKRGEFKDNVWISDEQCPDEWLEDNTTKHNLVGTGKMRKTVKNPTRKKPSVLPSIEPPHPGMSYNPSYEDHQNLLRTIAEKEEKIIKEEEHLKRVTDDMFNKVSVQQRDKMWMSEMSQGLTPEKDEEESDSEFKSINPPVKNKKKTLKQKRKQREHLQMELMKRNEKINKRKVSDLHHLRVLNKQIEKNQVKANVLRERRKKIQLLKRKEPKRLSAMKFEETDLEFNLGEDIAGNLRNLKKEGNLLSDRFKSLQKRNIIQPSVRKNRKRGKVKIYTKEGHKDDWITTVARAVKV